MRSTSQPLSGSISASASRYPLVTHWIVKRLTFRSVARLASDTLTTVASSSAMSEPIGLIVAAGQRRVVIFRRTHARSSRATTATVRSLMSAPENCRRETVRTGAQSAGRREEHPTQEQRHALLIADQSFQRGTSEHSQRPG